MVEAISNAMADAVAAVAPGVVQVYGRRRPASGLVYAPDVVVTTARALGGEDGLRVRRDDGEAFDAGLVGWDPSTSLAVLRVEGLVGRPVSVSRSAVRVGQLALAVGRSWSNGVTASAGIVSIVGGPLRTGRHRAIEEVIRTTAPMHDGFSGGAFIDTAGLVVGMTTAAEIRGLGVVIPARIVWKIAASVLERGRPHRGYLGLAGQTVSVPDAQRGGSDPGEALLVVAVSAGGPAAAAGILIGDLIVALDGQPVRGPEDLLDLLTADRIGRTVPLSVRRGGARVETTVTVGERADR
jgi:S1-C subfamily serine protease